MKVYNEQSTFATDPEIIDLVSQYRHTKNFNVSDYVRVKSNLLNQYMDKFGLKSCVIAVSGGLDSALVLSLVHYASQMKDSPIQKIVAVSLPVSHSKGATGQIEATSRAKELCLNLNIEHHVIELKHAHEVLEKNVSDTLSIQSSDWALGQLVAHTRTPTLYYLATLLTQEKTPAIIVGTTNRDEGLYLGYFGKASDGLVDLQLISDLHKSEVYSTSKFLNVPESILTVSPQGDMYDGRVDEEVFGASYDFVEYYLHYMTLTDDIKTSIFNSLSVIAQEQFIFYKNNLDNLHAYNRHKYFSASPAVHLDIDTMIIPEGWKTNCLFAKPRDQKIEYDNIVGLFETLDIPHSFFSSRPIDKKILHVQDKDIIHLSNVLSLEECSWLLSQTNEQQWLPANAYGKQKNFDITKETAQSHRLSIYNPILAYVLFNRIAGHTSHIKEFNSPFPIISNDMPIWVAHSLNPLFRYVRYQKNNELVAHYDDTYAYHSHKKTLLSIIIYLDNSEAQTRFVLDSQYNIKDCDKDFSDWNRIAYPEEVLISIPAKCGDVLLFDHRILHDATSPEFSKHILRTDMVFESPSFGFDL